MAELHTHPATVAAAQDRMALHEMLAEISDAVEVERDPIVGVAVAYVYRSGAIGHCTTNSAGSNLNALLGAIARMQTHLSLNCCKLPCQDRTTTPTQPA